MTIWRGTLAALAGLLLAGPARAEVNQLNVPLGAGGFGFLPMMMQKYQLVEKRARDAGLSLSVNWANVGGPAAMNDALLSGPWPGAAPAAFPAAAPAPPGPGRSSRDHPRLTPPG